MRPGRFKEDSAVRIHNQVECALKYDDKDSHNENVCNLNTDSLNELHSKSGPSERIAPNLTKV